MSVAAGLRDTSPLGDGLASGSPVGEGRGTSALVNHTGPGGGGRFFVAKAGESGLPQPAWGHTAASSGTVRWHAGQAFMRRSVFKTAVRD
jgi:hypothetical protein